MSRYFSTLRLVCLTALFVLLGDNTAQAVDPRQIYSFDDRPTDYEGGHPAWFKQSFLDLDEDLDDALKSDKSGLIVYFGQEHCAYCKLIMQDTLSKPDLVEYLIRHFDMVGLSIHDVRELTAPDGKTLTVKDYSIREDAQFTPTLTFFGKDRQKALTLRGFYPAYEMRAALEYVADGHYQAMSFRDYLAQANPPPLFDDEELISDPLFMSPPFAFDRRYFPASQPLAVIFEQPKCHACDVLHSDPLQERTYSSRCRASAVGCYVEFYIVSYGKLSITAKSRHSRTGRIGLHFPLIDPSPCATRATGRSCPRAPYVAVLCALPAPCPIKVSL